mmetsp:Transcript_5430/g.8021  ORF Transcript_5430/g.8021 Transcript_5430/m.8021 type:complete len:480 (-) Transcript_5430:109-1548(-)
MPGQKREAPSNDLGEVKLNKRPRVESKETQSASKSSHVNDILSGFEPFMKRYDPAKPVHVVMETKGSTGEWKTRQEDEDGLKDFLQPLVSSDSLALKFEVSAQWNGARASRLTLPHGLVHTPVFMPVGTQGTIKGLTSEQVRACGCRLILSNTYHLGNRPGGEVVEAMGRIHKFMNWDGNLLTDSGGFQMVSLLKLAKITEAGVLFQSPVNGSEMLLTPEKSMEIQNQIGADIMMALDDVAPSTCGDYKRFEEATHRTLRWIDRCIKAHKRPKHQNLYGIVQGGLDPKLREFCLNEMIKRNLPGYAIGGLAGGEDKALFWRVVKQCCDRLPKDKPRYLMGVGYTLDLVVCSALGCDQFDCVYPARTARFGTAITREGLVKLKKQKYKGDKAILDASTAVGRKYTRGYLHEICTKEATGSQLLTMHNIEFLQNFMRELRASIRDGSFGQFVQTYMLKEFPNHKYPTWAVEALLSAGIKID